MEPLETTPPPPPPQAPILPPGPALQPGKVQAIALMLLIGGIWGILWSIGIVWAVIGMGLATCGLGCVLIGGPIYGLVVGILSIIRGASLLSARQGQEPAPRTLAVLLIISIINLDVVSMVLGILTLVFLNEPQVRAWYREE